MAKILYFSVVFVFTIIISYSSANKCEQNGPCMCIFDEYSQINITGLIPSDTDFIRDGDGVNTYFFSGCKNKKFRAEKYKLFSNQTFDASLIKCIEVIFETNMTVIVNNKTINETVTNVIHNCSAIGSEKQIRYDEASDNTGGYQIVYNVKNKERSAPSIRLVCDTLNRTDLKIESEASDELTLYSPLVCIKYFTHHDLSTGSIFCIIFFTAAVIYFLGGGVIMYTARGARGVEVIPNFEFWASLPGLMRDGLVFILNGCKPVTTAAETYDRI